MMSCTPWIREQGYHDAGAPIETYLSRLGEELHAEIAVPVVKENKPTRPPKPKAAALSQIRLEKNCAQACQKGKAHIKAALEKGPSVKKGNEVHLI